MSTTTTPRTRCAAFALACLAAFPAAATADVNIYSYREPQLIDPLLKAATAKTGVKTNPVSPKVEPSGDAS